VRKVRKYRNNLKSPQNPSTEITSRKDSFNNIYKKELNRTSKYLKGKPTESKTKFDKIAKSELDIPDKILKTEGGAK